MAMTIANRLKRIASKWGVESKSHTIEDVLEDLENGLPFGVKRELVEIYPETGMSVYPFSITTGFDGELIPGKKYTVVFNNIPVVCEAYSLQEKPESWPDQYEGAVFLGNQIHAFSPHIFPNPVDTGEDFLFIVQKSGAAAWDLNQGLEKFSKVTLHILEEQEIVTPLDYKFMPEGYPKVEKKMVEIVPETTLTVGGTSPFPTLATGVEYFIEGKEYIVSVNGIQYRCVGGRRQDDRRRDLAILGTRTPDVPFEIYVFMTEGHSTFGSLDHQAQFWPLEDGDYTVAIYEEQEIVTPMNAKFADIIISNEDGVFSCNTTYAELRKMCENDPLSVVNVKYVEKTNINTEIKMTVKQLKNLSIYETQFAFEFGDYNSSTAVLYNSDGTIGTAGPV